MDTCLRVAGIYTGRVSVRGVMRTCKSLEDVAPQQVSNRKARLLRQRLCFRVARSALRGDLPRFAEHSMSGTTYPDMVFGRIQHFVRAGGTEDTPLLLARVYLFSGLCEADVVRDLEAHNLSFWRHDYCIINRRRHVTHLLPASLIGDMVTVIPHPSDDVASLGYSLVMQLD